MTDRFSKYGNSEEPAKKSINENIESKTSEFNDPFLGYSSITNPISKPEEESKVINEIPESVEVVPVSEKDTNQISLDSLIIELDTLVGLTKVKCEIKTLLQFVKVQELRRQKKISTSKPSMHSVFYGSPGTGKTTVARIYGKMLSAMGLLSKGHLVETDRSGLIGGYVGQSAIKTDEKITEALGGILFIDEAYSLSKGEDIHWDYGEEAIAILLKRMEDYRDDFVVIVAGYPEPMEKFLASNEGLRSRFSTYIQFDDYSPEEMAEIFKRLCIKENYAPTDEALEFVFTAIDYNYSIRDKSFGNARYVRNLFEVVIKNQASRIASTVNNPSSEDLRVIIPSDIPFITPTDTKVIQNSIPKKER